MPRKKTLELLENDPGPITLVCQKCGDQTAHAVKSVSVTVHHLRCLTCHSVGAYLFKNGMNEEACYGTALDLEALRKQLGQKDPHPYHSRDRFADGEFITHQTFGEGYVLAVDHPPVKMSVLFADRSRLLACGACPRKETEFTDKQTEEPSTDQAQGLPEGEQATCPKCGRIVHPYNLSRTADGRDTIGCTFCLPG